MITESHASSAPVFGRDGEPCPSCGAPLAGDQRYCLHCGARRPDARLEFLDVLDADVRARQVAPAPGAALAAAPVAPVGVSGRLNANAGLLAVAALLVLMLLIGLLLGHWVTQRDAATSPVGNVAAPAPQVIKVEGTAAAPTTSGDDSDSGSSSASKSPKAKSSTKAKAPKDPVSVKSLDSKKAVDDAVKKGKPISTGTGKLPPKDDKAPAGGADFEEIG